MAVGAADIAAQRLGAHPVPKRTLDELILEPDSDSEDVTPPHCGGEKARPIWHRSVGGELATAHNARFRNVAVGQFLTPLRGCACISPRASAAMTRTRKRRQSFRLG